ncbi:MAG: TonB-dependent receptor [Acidobacteria bacterium]|nr:TonB-dependent receptor [Acidobacteriota bacterium]
MSRTSTSVRSFVPAVGLAVLLIGLVPVRAVAQDLTGTLYGKVTSEDGLGVPGVTVTITSPQLIKGSEVRVTSETGGYRVPALPPGQYTVAVEMPGFQPMSRGRIVVEAGAALSVDFVLKLAALEETVTVTGESPLVDVRSTQVTRTVDHAVLENIPTRRTLQDVKLIVPGVTDAQYPLAPQSSLYGATPRDTQYNVDGANMNDNVVGYMLTDLSYDSVEEVQVTTAGVSAEFGQGGAGVFNFISKSGGNQFRGTAEYYFQNDAMQSDNVSDELKRAGFTEGSGFKKQLDYSGTFGGPFRRDRLWFFGNAKRVELEQTRPDFPAFNPTIDDTQYFLKLTSQVTKSINLQGSHSRRKTTLFPDDRTLGFEFNDAPEAWATGDRPITIWNLGSTQTLSDSTLLEVRYSQTYAGFNKIFPVAKAAYFDQVTGKVCCGQSKIEGEQKRLGYNIKANLSHYRESWLGGSHALKGGLDVTYAPNSSIRAQAEDMWVYVRNGAPFRVRLYNTPRFPEETVLRYAGFIQDAWNLRKRVTLNIGLRIESTTGWLPEQEGGGGLWSAVQTFAKREDLINWLTFAPRVGLVWDLKGDQQTSVKGSYGRYYKPLLTLHVGTANPNGTGYQEFDWIDRNGDRIFQPGEQGTLRNNSLPGADLIDPDLRSPFVDEIHVGLDRQLGRQVGVSIAGLYKRERNLLETLSVSHPFSAYNPISVVNPIDGQPITIYALDPAYQARLRVRMLTNPKDPEPVERTYKGVEFVMRKRMNDGWQFQASLNVGRSEGNVGTNFGQSSGTTAFYLDPNTLVNAYGPLDWDSPVQFKAQGTYLAPFAISVSAFYTFAAGIPLRTDVGFPTEVAGAYTVRYNRGAVPGIVAESFVEVAGERRGTHRADPQNLLTLRLQKQVPLGKSRRIDLTADIFNLLNNDALGAVQTLQFGHPNFLKPSRIERARNLRVGARISF